MQDTPSNSLSARPKAEKKTFFESVLSFAFALAVVFMIRWSVVESFKIPSGSLIPTLAIGDYLFVNKFSYGLKIPFTDIKIIPRSGPSRGDVIVFKYPRDESLYFIKRVIGVPGDTIELRDKVLYLNNAPVASDLLTPAQTEEIVKSGVLFDPQYTVERPVIYNEHLSGHDHLMMTDPSAYGGRNFGPVTVPPESYFAMGDNRDVSNDSRFWGFVPDRNIAGRAMFIWLSIWIDFGSQKIVFHPLRSGSLVR